MSQLGEMRSLATEALKIANDFECVAPPELHAGLEIIGNLLDSAIERIEGAMKEPRWPGLAARA
jgi:hypothetical protein